MTVNIVLYLNDRLYYLYLLTVSFSLLSLQTTVLAPTDGVVKEVLFAAGDTVPPNSRLLYFEDEEN